MSQTPLLQVLDEYGARWPAERDVVRRMQELIQTHPDCLERSCRPGHITGSAWVVSSDRKRFLMLRHKKLGKWLQPGGHADGEVDVIAVARREVFEETGLTDLELVDALPLDLDIHLIPDRFDPQGNLVEGAHEHYDLRFFFKQTGVEDIRRNEESHEVRWCSAHEVRTLTSEWSVLRLLEKALRLDS